MIAITARSLWARKRRLVATLLAVVLGVAFLAGTLLLSDTLRANFDRLFTQADGGTDVVLRGATQIGSGNSARTGVDASLLPRVRAVPGVADAQPYLQGYGQLLGRDGKPIGGNGPPTEAANWVGDPALNPYRLVAGHAPRADDEVVINRGAAKTGHLALGMTTTLLTPQPLRVHVVGITTFGTADGFGPGTFTGMTLHAARLYLTGPKGPGQAELTQILVRASPGVPATELAARLRPVLPAGVQAITGTQLATENLDDINSGFLGFLSTGLTAFAAIALLVAAFSIYNTFSILAAQRGRESALLRALGGTRRQLAVAGLAETLVVGVLGSVAGWAGGIGIAALLKGVFDGFGFALPAGGLVLRASSSVLAVTVGVAATVLAGVLPVLRGSRVPPLAALRELAAEPARISRARSVPGFLLIAGGVGAVIAGTAGGGQGAAVAGAVGTLAGFVVLGPVAIRPAAAVLGAPIAALRGVGGRLARDNALRNPRRTAATASALMVGVAVATLRGAHNIGFAVPAGKLSRLLDGRVGEVRARIKGGDANNIEIEGHRVSQAARKLSLLAQMQAWRRAPGALLSYRTCRRSFSVSRRRTCTGPAASTSQNPWATSKIRVSSVATMTWDRLLAWAQRSATCWIKGLPAIRASGFPGKRVEA